jgi:hypothetical protein
MHASRTVADAPRMNMGPRETLGQRYVERCVARRRAMCRAPMALAIGHAPLNPLGTRYRETASSASVSG